MILDNKKICTLTDHTVTEPGCLRFSIENQFSRETIDCVSNCIGKRAFGSCRNRAMRFELLFRRRVLLILLLTDPRTAASTFPRDRCSRRRGRTLCSSNASRSTEAHRTGGRWPEMTSLSCRSRGSERIDSGAALDRR